MKTWRTWIVFQRRLYFRSQAVEAISHIGDTGNQPNFGPGSNGSSLQFLYQQSQELFADIAIEAERPVPERYLTADTEVSGSSASDSGCSAAASRVTEVAGGSLKKVIAASLAPLLSPFEQQIGVNAIFKSKF